MEFGAETAEYSATMDADEVRARLVGALSAKQANATELSRKMGRSPGYISDFLRGKKSRLDGGASSYLEDALGLPRGSLIVTTIVEKGNTIKFNTSILNSDLYRRLPDSPRPSGALATAERDFPVYAAVEGGAGQMVISTDPIEVVARPWYLKGVKEGYGVLVTGESMEPRYEAGEIVVVNPKAALVRGKDCVVHTANDNGDFRAMLKRYVGQTEAEWKLRQFNPDREFTLKKQDWPFCVRVVGRYDGG